jgi:ribonuclease HI
MEKTIVVYPDGSCNPTHKIGGWAAIIFNADEKIILKGFAENTTHQRMELQAVIESLQFLSEYKSKNDAIVIYTDSQYVTNLQHRKHKIQQAEFLTKNKTVIRNDDLLRKIIHYIDTTEIEFVKVKAHLKASIKENFNRDADKLARQMVRQRVRTLGEGLN